MSKILLIFFIFLSIVQAKEIKFEETRYIASKNSTILKHGTLIINEENSILIYNDSKTRYLCNEKYIAIDEKEYSHEEQMELSLFFLVMEAIYKNNFKILEGYFSISQKDTIILTPNSYLSNVIDKIVYKKRGLELEFLSIYFINSDFITIKE